MIKRNRINRLKKKALITFCVGCTVALGTGLSTLNNSVKANAATVKSVWETDYGFTVDTGIYQSKHVQGVAADGNGHVYFSFTDSLIKTDMDGNVVGSVTGISGTLHLGDISYYDGKIYGSLMTQTSDKENVDAGPYIAIFDATQITTTGIDAMNGSVMQTVSLQKLLASFIDKGTEYDPTTDDEYAGKYTGGKYGIYQGLDSVTVGPKFGEVDGEYYLTAVLPAPDVQDNVLREDNRHLVMMQFDLDTLATYAQATDMVTHTVGPDSYDSLYYYHTGVYGQVQVVTYDDYTQSYMIGTYSEKSHSIDTHYTFYMLDASKAAVEGELQGVDYDGDGNLDKGMLVDDKGYGTYDNVADMYGMTVGCSTGITAMGDGYYYLCTSTNKPTEHNGLYNGKVTLFRWDEGRTNTGYPFVKVSNTFAMTEGASVRQVSPSGIRFNASMSTAEIPEGATFGMLLMPTSLLGESKLTVGMDNVLDITATKTYVEGDNTCFNGVLVGENGVDFGEAYYNVPLSARAYIKYTVGEKEIIRYTTATVERSVVQVANAHLATGVENKFLTEIVDTVVTELSFEETELNISVGDTATLTVNGTQGLAYTLTTDSDCITIDEDNQITAVAEGEGNITVKLGSRTATIPVMVIANSEVVNPDYEYTATNVTTWGWKWSQTESQRLDDTSGQIISHTDSSGNRYAYSEYLNLENIGGFSMVAATTRLQLKAFLYTDNSGTACIASTAGYQEPLSMTTEEFATWLAANPTAKYIRFQIFRKAGGNFDNAYYFNPSSGADEGTNINLTGLLPLIPDHEFTATDVTTWGWAFSTASGNYLAGANNADKSIAKGQETAVPSGATVKYAYSAYLNLENIGGWSMVAGSKNLALAYYLYTDNQETVYGTYENCVASGGGETAETSAYTMTAEDFATLLAQYPTAKYIRFQLYRISSGDITNTYWFSPSSGTNSSNLQGLLPVKEVATNPFYATATNWNKAFEISAADYDTRTADTKYASAVTASYDTSVKYGDEAGSIHIQVTGTINNNDGDECVQLHFTEEMFGNVIGDSGRTDVSGEVPSSNFTVTFRVKIVTKVDNREVIAQAGRFERANNVGGGSSNYNSVFANNNNNGGITVSASNADENGWIEVTVGFWNRFVTTDSNGVLQYAATGALSQMCIALGGVTDVYVGSEFTFTGITLPESAE